MQYCDNCGAEVEKCGRMSDGRNICCAHCVFNPLGCRCKYSEFGVAETYQDPEFPAFDYEDEPEPDWFDLQESRECDFCNGRGMEDDVSECPECNGTGINPAYW